MAAYRTGRKRTITYSGTFSGYAYQTTTGKPPIVVGNVMEISVAWWGVGNVSAWADGTGIQTHASLTVTGPVDNDQDLTPRTSKTLLEGSWELSISDVEEWVELTVGSDFPTYGGARVDGDVPYETTVRFYEVAQAGVSVARASITCGSVTSTAEQTLTTSLPLSDYELSIQLTGRGERSEQDADATFDALEATLPTYTKTANGVTIFAGGDALAVNTDNGTGREGVISVSVMPPMGFNLQGVLRADEEAYGTEATVRVHRKSGEDYAEVTVSSGEYSASYDQATYQIGGRINGTPQDLISSSEFETWFYHWLVPPEGEDASQWRLMLRGAYYTAGTLQQAEKVVLDGGFSFSSPPATRSLSPPKSMAGYRWLCVQTDRPSTTITLTIAAKTWTVLTDTSGLARFDLCGPSNLATVTDARDSRWPLPTDVDTVTGDGAMWGVVNVSSYTLEAATLTLVPLDGVYLSRDTWSYPPGHSLVNVQAPHLYWVPSGSANEYKRPLLRGDTDGRRSLDEADWTRTVRVPTIYTPASIEDLFEAVNAVDSGVTRNPGWTATLNEDIDVADGAAGTTWMDPDWALLNKNRNAQWLEGGGIAYYDGAWHYGLDLDCSSARTLMAQMLVDKVIVYPMCGDAFGLRTGTHRWEYGSDAESGRIELRGGRWMRGVPWGLIYGPGVLPYEGATVQLLQLPDEAPRGVGVSEENGEYLTGTPGGEYGVEHRVKALVGDSPPHIDSAWYSGVRLRRCFAVQPGLLGCIECDGPRAWLHVAAQQQISTYRLWGWTLSQASDDYPVDEWRRLRTNERTGGLLMLGRDGSTHMVYLSYDGGLTAEEVLTVTATSAAIEVDSERGAAVLLYENGGNVQVRRSFDGGATWSDPETCLFHGTPAGGTILDMAHDARRGVMLVAMSAGGSVGIYASYDLGATWQLVVS